MTLENEISEWFQVKVGVYQGPVLSPPLFAIVTNALNNDVVKTIKNFLYAKELFFLG